MNYFFMHAGVLGIVVPNAWVANFWRQNFRFLFVLQRGSILITMLLDFVILPFWVFQQRRVIKFLLDGHGGHQALQTVHPLTEMKRRVFRRKIMIIGIIEGYENFILQIVMNRLHWDPYLF